MTYKRTNGVCGNNTWDYCIECGEFVCGIHVIMHYRRLHPGSI